MPRRVLSRIFRARVAQLVEQVGFHAMFTGNPTFHEPPD